ncbi:MAG: bifunctional DNA primase/polymerase [Nitrospira sp.]|nr:bifunctional DNA primase/polymerase [Nitrospira sp.]
MPNQDTFKYLIDDKKFPLIRLTGKLPNEGGTWKGKGFRSFEDLRFTKDSNAGVVTGALSGLIVLDVDNRELFLTNGYPLPKTLTVKTGKGFHYYYQLPEGENHASFANRAIRTEGFDIRAEGGYVVAPGSIHPDNGNEYEITNDAELAQAPIWLLKLSWGISGLTVSKANSCHNADNTEVSLNAPTPDEIQEELNKVPPDLIEEISGNFGSLITDAGTRGKRSERIWRIIHQLLEDDYSSIEIAAVFEATPDGIGQKYYEKGAERFNWLENQIIRVETDIQGRIACTVKAKDQEAVFQFKYFLLNSFDNWNRDLTDAHKDALEDIINLFVAIYEGSYSGWFSIQLPVGTGKTQLIYHFIEFLNLHDKERKFSMAISFEKIEEIEKVKEWLLGRGVAKDYFQIVHSKLDNLAEVYKLLPTTPVVIHTHAKLRGSTYTNQYYQYEGKARDLLIFDESMLNSMLTSQKSSDVISSLEQFLREYQFEGNLKESIPAEIFTFFQKLSTEITDKERQLRQNNGINTISVEVDNGDLVGFSQPALVGYSNMISSAIGNGRIEDGNPLFGDLLLIADSEKESRSFHLSIDQHDKTCFFASKEIMSSEIPNLITTDASREFRTLFQYTCRKDGKKVMKYGKSYFVNYDELCIRPINLLASGKVSIASTFEETKSNDNPYLKSIGQIISAHKKLWKVANEEAIKDYIHRLPLLEQIRAEELVKSLNQESFDKKSLFFYSKDLKIIPEAVKFYLLANKILTAQEIEKTLLFETFGRENASNEYRDCSVVIFLGLNWMRKNVIKGLLAGEGMQSSVAMNILDDVMRGELVMQLQQGIGRGTLRKGEAQWAYFFDSNCMQYWKPLEKAFPGADLKIILTRGAKDDVLRKDILKRESNPDTHFHDELGDKDLKKNLVRAAENAKVVLTHEQVTEYIKQKKIDGGLPPVKWFKSIGLI